MRGATQGQSGTFNPCDTERSPDKHFDNLRTLIGGDIGASEADQQGHEPHCAQQEHDDGPSRLNQHAKACQQRSGDEPAQGEGFQTSHQRGCGQAGDAGEEVIY